MPIDAVDVISVTGLFDSDGIFVVADSGDQGYTGLSAVIKG